MSNVRPSKNPEPITNNSLVKIGQASQILGISIDTIRRWEKKGFVSPLKSLGGTRLYDLEQLRGIDVSDLKHKKVQTIQPSVTRGDSDEGSRRLPAAKLLRSEDSGPTFAKR